jgi:hypothetical protein
MRKFILTAAIVLVSVTAHAEPWRSLSLASQPNAKQLVDQPDSAQKPVDTNQVQPQSAKPADSKAADAGPADVKPADDIKAVDAKPADAGPADVKPVAKAAEVKPLEARPAKPKARHVSVESRIVYELHRRGIYW